MRSYSASIFSLAFSPPRIGLSASVAYPPAPRGAANKLTGGVTPRPHSGSIPEAHPQPAEAPMNAPSPEIAALLDAVRRGDADTAGELLEHYRPWLQLLARLQI